MNNPTEEEIKSLDSWLLSEFHYAIVGKEVGEAGDPASARICAFKAEKAALSIEAAFYAGALGKSAR